LAARMAKGKYLLFMDDDNIAKPDELSTFLKVSEKMGHPPIMTCFTDYFQSLTAPKDVRVHKVPSCVFLGNAVELGLFKNTFGDANMFIDAHVFRQLGGFSEEEGLAYEDWDLLARAALSGIRIEVVPLSLFWKRGSYGEKTMTTYGTTGLKKFSSYQRIVKSYANYTHSSLLPLLTVMQYHGTISNEREPEYVPPLILREVKLAFESGIELLGVSMPSGPVKAGSTVSLVFVWKAVALHDVSWTVFVHLRDSHKRNLAQADDIPKLVDGTPLTTDTWRLNEIITDYHTLWIPPTLRPDSYSIYIGWFRMLKDPRISVRLPILQDYKREDEFTVGDINVISIVQ